MARTLLLLIIATPSNNSLFTKLKDMVLKTDNPCIEIDMDSAKNDFFLSLEHLIKSKIHDVWYIMAQYLLDYQKRHNCKLINGDFVSLQMARVFRNIMSHKEVNFLGKTIKYFAIKFGK